VKLSCILQCNNTSYQHAYFQFCNSGFGGHILKSTFCICHFDIKKTENQISDFLFYLMSKISDLFLFFLELMSKVSDLFLFFFPETNEQNL
jgi:hypothetical protein